MTIAFFLRYWIINLIIYEIINVHVGKTVKSVCRQSEKVTMNRTPRPIRRLVAAVLPRSPVLRQSKCYGWRVK